MRRPYRVVLEILSPPLVAFALAIGFFQLEDPSLGTNLKLLPQLLLLAYFAAGLPSLVFALLMELAFARWFEPWSGWTMLLASGLGGLAGLAVNLILRDLNDAGLVRFLVVLGLATGAVVGLLIVAAARLGGSGRRGLP